MMYLAADIHGHIRLDWLKSKIESIDLTHTDYLLILGDAGIVWDENEPQVFDYYSSLPCTVLFIDGNHENFTLLNALPVEEKYGGMTHRISSNIFHLMRGEVYSIGKVKLFTFGGGFSKKKLSDSSPVYVWDEEMPDAQEYENGEKNLNLCEMKVNIIATHVAPTSIAYAIGEDPLPEETMLNDYLDNVRMKTSYDHWYFGHYHRDVSIENADGLYERIIALDV